MDEIQTMTRTQLAVNDAVFYLAPDEDAEDLKLRIESAAKTKGRFVEFMVVGDRRVSVLVSSRTAVVFSVETVQFASHDSGDGLMPFSGNFDL